MKIGINGGIGSLDIIHEAHLDYLEACFGDLANMPAEELKAFCDKAEKLGIPAETANGFFPGTMKLLDGSTSMQEIAEFTDRGMQIVKRLGCEITVIGSGAARTIPDGMEKEAAEKKFAEILNVVGDIGAKYSIQVVVEPLRYCECNFINTVTDGWKLKQMSGNANVHGFVDFFHFFMNGETLDELDQMQGDLIHAHLARPNPDRCAPLPEDMDICRTWADKLRTMNYKGRMTMECRLGSDPCLGIERAKPVMDLFRAI